MNLYIFWLRIKHRLLGQHYWEDHIDYLQCRFCGAWHSGQSWCRHIKDWVDDEFCGQMCETPCWENQDEVFI